MATAAGIGHVNLVKFGSVVFELREYRHTDKTRSILKNVGPIRHCEPFYIAIHLRIDVYNDNNDLSLIHI